MRKISVTNKNKIGGVVYPILAALIWGLSFPMQSICIKHMSAFYINGIRAFIASIPLAVIVFFIYRKKKKAHGGLGTKKDIIIGSLISGTLLFAAVNFQQIGMAETDAGKSGFITSMYIVLVPIFGIFIGKKTGKKMWLSVVLAVIGLFFLCVGEGFSIATSDLLILCCAAFFALQMMVLDKYIGRIDGITLSLGQTLVSGTLSLVCAFIFEDFSAQDIGGCLNALLYIAIMSCCVAYTLQVKSYESDASPTMLALLFSLESVFAVIGGAVILGETLKTREWAGCLIMFAAVLLAEVPLKKPKFRRITIGKLPLRKWNNFFERKK